MSTNEGYFNVINSTGGDITNVAVTIANSSFGPNTFKAPFLEKGGTSSPPTALKTSSSATDHWSVAFVGSDNQLYTGYKNCGFESDDNGGTVRIVLNAENFDIDMPKSSSCTDNDYDQT